MERDAFYALIDKARPAAATDEAPGATPEALEEALKGLSDAEVAAFALRFEAELVRLNEWRVWGAGYMIAGGMGDDSFHYFRSWLVGKGEAAVERALSDPDGLGPFVTDPEETDNELLEYVAIEVLETREVEDPREGTADDEPRGQPFDEETVVAAYPRLAARFSG